MQRLQFSNSSQLPTWTSYLPSQNTHNCSLVDINSNNIRSLCQAGLCWCTALLLSETRRFPWLGNASEIFFFWQMHAKMEVCNQFCPCYFYYSNLLSMPNTGAEEKMFDSTTAAGSSSHPFELLTVSQSCLLAAADPNQNWPVCVADLPKDKAVAIMSSLINAFLKTTMSTCLS